MDDFIQDVENLIVDHSLAENDQDLPLSHLWVQLLLQIQHNIEHISRCVQINFLLIYNDIGAKDIPREIIFQNSTEHNFALLFDQVHIFFLALEMLENHSQFSYLDDPHHLFVQCLVEMHRLEYLDELVDFVVLSDL